MPGVAKADIRSADELREIGCRLCALIDFTLEAPVTAEQPRQVVDDPTRDESVRFALNACADELAAHELPTETRELLDTAKEYAAMLNRHDLPSAARTPLVRRAGRLRSPKVHQQWVKSGDFAKSDPVQAFRFMLDATRWARH